MLDTLQLPCCSLKVRLASFDEVEVHETNPGHRDYSRMNPDEKAAQLSISIHLVVMLLMLMLICPYALLFYSVRCFEQVKY